MLLVKMGKYAGFWVHRRSYLLCPPPVIQYHAVSRVDNTMPCHRAGSLWCCLMPSLVMDWCAAWYVYLVLVRLAAFAAFLARGRLGAPELLLLPYVQRVCSVLILVGCDVAWSRSVQVRFGFGFAPGLVRF